MDLWMAYGLELKGFRVQCLVRSDVIFDSSGLWVVGLKKEGPV